MSGQATVLMANSFAITLKLDDSKDSLDGIFMGCDSFDFTQEVIQFREVTGERWGDDGRGRPRLTNIPGNAVGGNLTLRRGMSVSTSLWKWFESVQNGKWFKQRRTVSLTFYENGSAQTVFKFAEAWPTRYRIGEMRTDASNVQIEEVEIAYEGFKREKA
jgi:phage tail-like protein